MNTEINFDEMKKCEEEQIVRTVFEAVTKFFELPEVQEDFEKWKEEEKKKRELPGRERLLLQA